MTPGRDRLQAVLRKFGYEVRRYAPESSPTAQLVAGLRRFEIDVVLDVGANRGQFASGLRGGGYDRDILSFEPLADAHRELQRASAADPRWTVFPRCALGDRAGEVEIHVAGNSESSSLLPMLESHRAAAPHSAYVGTESVPLTTLDAAVAPALAAYRRPFLKIDVQGFEWQVLNGAGAALSRMRGALLELSLLPLYEGQHLWRELIGRMEQAGFTLWSLQPLFVDPRDGRTLQVDAVFFRVP